MPQSLSTSTDSPDGEALDGLIVTLELRSGPYDVSATFTAQQRDVASVTTWVLQNTYVGPFNGLSLISPGQVEVDSTGRILIADTGNNRLVILTSAGVYSTGITGLTGIIGVCVDLSNNVYVAERKVATGESVWRKYNTSLVQQWIVTYGFGFGAMHVATDGTHLFALWNDTVRKYLCSTGAFVSSYGTPGFGDLQFDGPWGIATDGSRLYIVDSGNSRVLKHNRSGVYITEWSISANARGIAVDTSGNVLVAEYGQDVVNRYTNTGTFIDSFSQTDPSGIGVVTGDVLFVSNAGAGTIAKWDESSTPGGYGEVAIEINGSLSPYTGIGNREGAVSTVATAILDDPTSITVRAFAKATAGTMSLESCVLSVNAVPRR